MDRVDETTVAEKKATKKTAKKAEEKRTLEELFRELETVTAELEAQELPLEEAFLKYRRGMELLKECNAAVDTVEKELQILEEA
ncbi:MAG: exodeoxyribonuclease VII small subunit [Lachnospiraceae bacterium]|nr:exodeoxyribonuclease VII small subunit [Lachnospiraceae bacterium]